LSDGARFEDRVCSNVSPSSVITGHARMIISDVISGQIKGLLISASCFRDSYLAKWDF
jgi:hypothetical protein